MNDTRDFGWYYFSPDNRAPAWSGVEFLYNFLTGDPQYRQENGGEGPYAQEILFSQGVREGDVIQLANQMGDYYHTLIITGFDGRIPLVCAHNDDAYMRPLSTYRFGNARFLRPIGSRLYADTGAAFEELLAGMAYRPPVLATPEVLLKG